MVNWLGLATLLGFGLIGYVLVLIAYTAWKLTHPARRTYASALARGIPGDPSELDAPRAYTSVEIRSRGRALPAWRVPGDDPDGPVAVLSHGWSDGRLGGLVRLAGLLGRCSEAVLWESPGHGVARGVCTLGVGEVEDLLTIVEEVAGGRRVVLLGWSMGAGVSIEAGARLRAQGRPAAGIVAEAPYRWARTPARNVLRARGLPHLVNLAPALWVIGLVSGAGVRWRRFDRAAHAAELGPTGLMVLHGTADAVSPLGEARAIVDAAPRGRLVEIPDGTHNGLWTDETTRRACVDAVERFLEEVCPPGTPGAITARGSTPER